MWDTDELPAEVEYTNQVDFVPPEIFQEFPSLTGLGIQHYKIPVLKNGFFSSEFQNLEYLYLGGTEIAEIESGAFKELVNLKWLKLWGNTIEAINLPIFKSNLKLIYISLNSNEISKLNPMIFDGLSELKKLDFEANNCTDVELVAKADSLTRQELDGSFCKCFYNCRSDPDCSAEIVKTDSEVLKRILNELANFKQFSVKMEENVATLSADIKSLKQTNDNLLKRFEDFENKVLKGE
jgi:Leucine-rich repeat (LRR) protein